MIEPFLSVIESLGARQSRPSVVVLLPEVFGASSKLNILHA